MSEIACFRQLALSSGFGENPILDRLAWGIARDYAKMLLARIQGDCSILHSANDWQQVGLRDSSLVVKTLGEGTPLRTGPSLPQPRQALLLALIRKRKIRPLERKRPDGGRAMRLPYTPERLASVRQRSLRVPHRPAT